MHGISNAELLWLSVAVQTQIDDGVFATETEAIDAVHFVRMCCVRVDPESLYKLALVSLEVK